MKASAPVFHRVTFTVAASAPVRMKWCRLGARPVLRADTPRQTCRACMTADLPLPLVPDTRVT